MYKLIITLTFALISFNSQANQNFPRYGEPVETFYKTVSGNNIFGQTGQKAKASIITCKMAKYNSSDIYSNDDLIPNLTFEMRPVGVYFSTPKKNYKFGHVIIKKNGQLEQQLMPEPDHTRHAPFVDWDEGYIDGSLHMFGNGWAINYNTFTSSGGLYFGHIENFSANTPRYVLRSCSSDRSYSAPVFAIISVKSNLARVRFYLETLTNALGKK